MKAVVVIGSPRRTTMAPSNAHVGRTEMTDRRNTFKNMREIFNFPFLHMSQDAISSFWHVVAAQNAKGGRGDAQLCWMR